MTEDQLTAQLTLRYDGPGLAENRMDVEDLIAVLDAGADAIRATTRVTEPGMPEPRVQVVAITPGSFIVQFTVSEGEVLSNVAAALFNLSTQPATLTWVTVVSTIVTTVATLTQLGRGEAKVVEQAPGVRVVESADGTTVELSENVYLAMRNGDVRSALRDLVQPLRRPGVNSLAVKSDNAQAGIQYRDLPTFETDVPFELEEDMMEVEPDVDGVRSATLTLDSVVFTEGNKWKLSEGDNKFFATIEDTNFLERVTHGTETFGRNDVLKVQLETKSSRDLSGKVKVGYSVLKVDEHLAGAREVALPFVVPPPPNDPIPTAVDRVRPVRHPPELQGPQFGL